MERQLVCLFISALLSLLPPSPRLKSDTKCPRASSKVGLSSDVVGLRCRIGRMAGGFFGAFKKVGINTLSSAAGTATVLGVHSAFMPSGDTPRVVDSQLYNPVFETEKSLLNLHLGDSGTFLVISASCLALALVGICAASYCGCGCSPSARRARRERAEYQRLVREGEAKHRERAAIYEQEMADMDQAAQKLQRLSRLQEKRRLERSAGEPLGEHSTPGEPVTILMSPSSSEASTSAIEMTETTREREVTNPLYGANLNLIVGTNPDSINY